MTLESLADLPFMCGDPDDDFEEAMRGEPTVYIIHTYPTLQSSTLVCIYKPITLTLMKNRLHFH